LVSVNAGKDGRIIGQRADWGWRFGNAGVKNFGRDSQVDYWVTGQTSFVQFPATGLLVRKIEDVQGVINNFGNNRETFAGLVRLGEPDRIGPGSAVVSGGASPDIGAGDTGNGVNVIRVKLFPDHIEAVFS